MKRQFLKKPVKSIVVADHEEKSDAPAVAQQQARRSEMVKKEIRSEKGVLECTGCGAVYFDKHWHGKEALKEMMDGVETLTALCDVCHTKMMRIGSSIAGFTGEVLVENISTLEAKAEILSLIRNISKRAQAKDPMERVLRIDEQGKKMTIYVSENQLAVTIGKELHSAMKGGTLTITWSDDDKPVRVYWRMKS
jgi:transcription antitermination factor NusA-like protein